MAETSTAAAAATPNGTGAGAGASTNTNGSSAPTDQGNNANRGLPYYEKLRRELRDTLQKKRLMDKNMSALEDSIYRFEHQYLEETSAGNIIKGFDNYIKGSSTSGIGQSSALGSMANSATRKKNVVSDQDRVFSRSSAGFMRDSPAPSSTQTTPSHAATPLSGLGSSSAPTNTKDGTPAANSSKGGSGANKKNSKKSGGGGSRDKDDDDADGSGNKQPAKRLKITYGRD